MEDPLWARITLLDQLDEARGISLAELKLDNSSATPLEPPSLSVIPPPESGEVERAASIPVTPTTPTPNLHLSTLSSRPRPHTRRQGLLRPLFIYAMLNPGISYVQGMHQIVAVLVWIFSSTNPPPLEAEAAAFFALGALLSELRNLYMPSLDGAISPLPFSPQFSSPNQSTPVGLGATLSRFTSLITWLDPIAAASLEKKGLDPTLYVFKWLTTLFVPEFQLPDLVRVWDRLSSVYPEADQGNEEALPPVLGHLIDLSLGMVMLERPKIVSPFVNFEKCIHILQNPQIEGETVDKLLGIAWEIRTRRLGKAQPKAVTNGAEGGSNDWRTAASKWSSVAAVSTASTATSLNRWWSAKPSTPIRGSQVGEYDLDDSVSVAGSDTSAATAPPISSRAHRYGFSPVKRVRSSTISEFATIAGKVLPPPPEKIDERESLASLMQTTLPLPPSMIDVNDGEDDYDGESEAGEDDDDEDRQRTLREQAASGWGGLKASFTRLAASDRAAALSKATTNLSVQAQILREQVAEKAPERLAKIRENVTGFIPSSNLSPGGSNIRRPGSPVSESFVPPSGIRRPVSPLPSSVSRDSFSSPSGPKPLLLSGSARRAVNTNQDTISPPDSRRNSTSWRSPSPTSGTRPLFPPEGPLPDSAAARRYSNTPLMPRVLASTFHSRAISVATSSPTSLGLDVSEDSPIQSRRLRSPTLDGSDSSPAGNGRLRRSLRHESQEPEKEQAKALPLVEGRGWSLSDSVIKSEESTPPRQRATSISNTRARPAPLDLAFIDKHADSLHQVALASPTSTSTSTPSKPQTPPPTLPQRASRVALPLSPESPMKRSQRTHSIHDYEAPPPPASRPSTIVVDPVSPRPRPARTPSVDSESSILSPSTNDSSFPPRSKIVRRAPVSSSGKRVGRAGTGSISSLQDEAPSPGAVPRSVIGVNERRSMIEEREKRRSVSSFLVGGAEVGSSGDETKRQVSIKRKSRGKEMLLDQAGAGESGGEWDQILSAYGE